MGRRVSTILLFGSVTLMKSAKSVIAIGAIGLGLSGSALSDSKPWKGETLRVLSFRDTHSSAVLESKAEFEAMSGAKVVMDTIAGRSVAAKTTTDQLGGGSYDVYAVDEPFVPKLSGFFLPLSEWPSSQLFEPKSVAPDKFLQAARDGAMFKGVQYGLPINGNVYMYVYRQDLLTDSTNKSEFKKKYGYDLASPKTLQQMEDLAAFFTRPPEMYGFAPFTRKSEGTTVEAMWLLGSFGVQCFDQDLKVVLDEKRTAEAFAWYKKMMQYSPRGSKSWHHSERMSAYGRGQVVQIMTWPSFVKSLEDPKKSKVVGKSAYAIPPFAKGGKPSPVAGTWSLSISKKSKKQALAAEFAYWWGSQSSGKKLVAKGMNPARHDLLQDPELLKENPWFDGILKNFEVAIVRPRFPQYKRVSDSISKWFTRMVAESVTPMEAAKGLRKDLDKLGQKLVKRQ